MTNFHRWAFLRDEQFVIFITQILYIRVTMTAQTQWLSKSLQKKKKHLTARTWKIITKTIHLSRIITSSCFLRIRRFNLFRHFKLAFLLNYYLNCFKSKTSKLRKERRNHNEFVDATNFVFINFAFNRFFFFCFFFLFVDVFVFVFPLPLPPPPFLPPCPLYHFLLFLFPITKVKIPSRFTDTIDFTFKISPLIYINIRWLSSYILSWKFKIRSIKKYYFSRLLFPRFFVSSDSK